MKGTKKKVAKKVIESQEIKKTENVKSCASCDYYYKIQELCKLNPVTVDKKPGDWCGQFK